MALLVKLYGCTVLEGGDGWLVLLLGCLEARRVRYLLWVPTPWDCYIEGALCGVFMPVEWDRQPNLGCGLGPASLPILLSNPMAPRLVCLASASTCLNCCRTLVFSTRIAACLAISGLLSSSNMFGFLPPISCHISSLSLSSRVHLYRMWKTVYL